jgi:hypothetical protein
VHEGNVIEDLTPEVPPWADGDGRSVDEDAEAGLDLLEDRLEGRFPDERNIWYDLVR